METTTESVTVKSYPSIVQSFGIAGMLVALMLVSTPIHFFLIELVGRDATSLMSYLLSTGLCFWIVFTLRRNATGESTFVLRMNNPRVAPLLILATLALLFGIIAPLQTLIPMPEFFREVFRKLLNQNSVFAFAMIVIAAPILEELIFRGVMLDGLLKKYSPVKSILVSSVLFGLVHLNPWQFIAGFVVGVFSGWVYYRSRSLLACILIHAATNLTAFIIPLFLDLEKSYDFDDTVLDLYGSGVNLIIVVLGCLVLLWACVKMLDRAFSEETDTSA